MYLLRITLLSLWNRRFNTALLVIMIALSVMLLVGVERLRSEALAGFSRSVSGTDLIVGARTGSVNLLLFSVFRIGSVSNNMSAEAYRRVAGYRGVAWSIPIVLGDNYRGFPVLGTGHSYFEHFRYGQSNTLEIAEGREFAADDEIVLGAAVARELGYGIGDRVVVAHGAGEVSFMDHSDHPFHVVGILAPTGTPVDRTLHAGLAGMDAIHEGLYADQHGHDPLAGAGGEKDLDHSEDHPESTGHTDLYRGGYSAILLGLESRSAAVPLQRAINQYEEEALSAILPGVALQELWAIVGMVERMLMLMSVLVAAVAIAGLFIALTTTLDQRRREMAILRSVGARPAQVFLLIVSEATLITVTAVAVGIGLVYLSLMPGQRWLFENFGIYMQTGFLDPRELSLVVLVLLAGFLVSVIPAIRVYLHTLADGISVRL